MAKPDIFEVTWSNRRGSEAEVAIARLLAIVRLAAVCEVASLDAGTIERILQNDASVCGAASPSAFARLRGLLQRHYQQRQRAVERPNDVATNLIVDVIIECLRMQTSKVLAGPEAYRSVAS